MRRLLLIDNAMVGEWGRHKETGEDFLYRRSKCENQECRRNAERCLYELVYEHGPGLGRFF